MIDIEYTWGRPKTYLTDHQVARLEILRGKLEAQLDQADQVAAAADSAAEGDQ